MGLREIRKTFKHLGRYREIVGVLVKYGFEDILIQMNVDRIIRRTRKIFLKKESKQHRHKSRGERVRLALEELGPTFIKLGQMLSTRFDLIPPAYLTELRRLQDEVSPFPFHEVRTIVENELNGSIKSKFRHFERKCTAAASLAQVHRACTPDGKEVVVKVQRAHIHEVIANDLPVLRDLANLLDRYVPESHVFDPKGLVSEFERWIREELDFLQEARNINRFRQNFQGSDLIYAPEVYWDLTTDRVLTMEYVEGIRIDRVDALVQAGLDPKKIARNGTLAVLKQIFEHRFFHGDPHPGNIYVKPNHVIAPLDFGLMGRLDRILVYQVGYLLQGMVNKSPERITRTLIDLNRLRLDVDQEALRIAVSDLLDRYYGVPANQFSFETFFNDLVELIKIHNIRFPRTLYLMGKTLIIMESIAQRLDPEFDLIGLAGPYVSEVILMRHEPERLLKMSVRTAEDYIDLITTTPRTLKRILSKMRWGDLGIELHHQGIDEMLNEFDRGTNRISFSLVIAALIIGSSVISHLDKGPELWGLPAIGTIGFLTAGILGLWLAISIIRSGHI